MSKRLSRRSRDFFTGIPNILRQDKRIAHPSCFWTETFAGIKYPGITPRDER
jgi:hypothetical protein